MLRPARDVLLCLGFFTRLPLPAIAWSAGDLATAIWAAPVVGAVVGAAGAAAYAAGDMLGLPPTAAAGLALAATMLLTGCLHEDGLADTADGFGGGSTRERKLEIMRDSRLGTFGVCALGLSLLLRWSALAAIGDPVAVAWALVAAHAAGRAAMPAVMLALPPARPSGLAEAAGRPSSAKAALAALLGVLALWPLGSTALFAGVVALLAWSAVLGWLAMRQVGGHTGDVLGAVEQGGEIVILLAVVGSRSA